MPNPNLKQIKSNLRRGLGLKGISLCSLDWICDATEHLEKLDKSHLSPILLTEPSNSMWTIGDYHTMTTPRVAQSAT